MLKICYDFLFHEKKIEILTYLILFLCLIFLFFNFYFNGEYLKVFLSLKEGLRECYHKLFFKSAGNFIGSAANGLLGIFLFAPQGSFCACTQTTNVGINIKTFLFYIIEAVYYISPLFFLLAIWSFLFLLKDKKINFYKRSLFAVWVFIGYLLLSLFHIKWGKFITPILPVFALSSGVFISDYVKRPRVKKAVILLLGISTVFYYSYLSKAYIHCFETIGEGIISHAPVKSKFLYTAEQVAARINDYNTGKTDELITIGFLDKESARFQGAWFSDSSMKVSNLTKTFLTKGFRMTDFWSLSDDFYHSLHKQDFVILITKKKIKKIEDYLFPEEPKKIPNLKFDIIYEDWLKEDVFIYLLKVSKI
ncbi:MAG: hypothetical protein KKB22_07190 [Candidatus Omnitrophica bacterium]|nr:hypothetical protein [Candidatus Omnitrophota bacterium]